jgi:hypothetical protein
MRRPTAISVSCVRDPVGLLSITNAATGGLNISATRFDWSNPANPPGSPPGVGDFASGTPTNITYSGGVVASATNPFGQIKDVDIGSGVVTNFLQFYTSITPPSPPGTGALQANPVFDLTALQPGGSTQGGALNNCAGVTAISVSCSPLIGSGEGAFVSPLVLTNRGTFTDVSFGVFMLGRDATGSAQWSGGSTMQVISQGGVRLTPEAIQALLNSGGSITNTYSGTFAGTGPSATPEPASILLLGAGLAGIGTRLRKRRSNAA